MSLPNVPQNGVRLLWVTSSARASPKRAGPLRLRERPESREETPKEGSGRNAN